MCKDYVTSQELNMPAPSCSRLRAKILRASRTYPTILFQIIFFTTAQAESLEKLEFDSSFFRTKSGENYDISAYSNGNPVTPGTFNLDIYINDVWFGKESVTAISNKDGTASFCINKSQLIRWGANIKSLEESNSSAISSMANKCIDFEKMPEQINANFNMSDLRIDLSIPQAYMTNMSRGYVDPNSWDQGVTAGFINYRASANRSENNAERNSQIYVGLSSGLNIGPWRLRQNGGYRSEASDNFTTAGKYQAISTYAERDITSLRSQLNIGEFYTPGEIFDSTPYLGIQLNTDDRMLPDSIRGFAPQVRGTAETNSTVTIRQGSNILYEKTVPAGPFLIEDLYATSYAGDLQVTVKEANGQSKTFTVPFASVAQLLRPGASRYNITAGTYRNDDYSINPAFIQSTYQRGISNNLSAYTGGIFANGYTSFLMGNAVSTQIGAFGLDTTYSSAKKLDRSDTYSMSGQSYRLSYSELISSSQTHFTLAAYRFSSEGYLTLSDYALLKNRPSAQDEIRPRSRLQMNIDQPLSQGYGSVYFSGSSQNYWSNNRSTDMTYQAGYSNNYWWGGLNLNLSRSQAHDSSYQNQIMVSVSVPIGTQHKSGYLTSSTSYIDKRNNSSQISYNSQAGDNNEIDYNISASADKSDSTFSKNTAFFSQYRTSSMIVDAGVTSSSDYKQYNAGASGSLVIHEGGITSSQFQGETMTIISAPGAQNTQVDNGLGMTLDKKGYAVISGMTPYRENTISLDPKDMADDIELEVTSQKVSPRYGSITKLVFPTRKGTAVLLTLEKRDGKSLPIGSQVLDSNGNFITLLGQGNRLFIRTEKAEESLTIIVNKLKNEKCIVKFNIPQKPDNTVTGYIQVQAKCAD